MRNDDRLRAAAITEHVKAELAARNLTTDADLAARRAAYAVVRVPTKAARRLAVLDRVLDDTIPDTVPVAPALRDSSQAAARVEAVALEAALAAAVRCRICGRGLTDPASVAAGIGPDCAGKARR